VSCRSVGQVRFGRLEAGSILRRGAVLGRWLRVLLGTNLGWMTRQRGSIVSVFAWTQNHATWKHTKCVAAGLEVADAE
jgi:hypothetical protein